MSANFLFSLLEQTYNSFFTFGTLFVFGVIWFILLPIAVFVIAPFEIGAVKKGENSLVYKGGKFARMKEFGIEPDFLYMVNYHELMFIIFPCYQPLSVLACPCSCSCLLTYKAIARK